MGEAERPTFGQRVKEMRERRGIGPGELADKLDISPRTLERWENEGHSTWLDVAARVADVLDVSLDYLAGLTDDPELNGAAA
jgi:transcriptional regulator with XRE-family HTH domain